MNRLSGEKRAAGATSWFDAGELFGLKTALQLDRQVAQGSRRVRTWGEMRQGSLPGIVCPSPRRRRQQNWRPMCVSMDVSQLRKIGCLFTPCSRVTSRARAEAQAGWRHGTPAFSQGSPRRADTADPVLVLRLRAIAGIVHTPSSRAISVRAAPRTSPERASVRTRNLSAGCTTGRAFDAHTASRADATSRFFSKRCKLWQEMYFLGS